MQTACIIELRPGECHPHGARRFAVAPRVVLCVALRQSQSAAPFCVAVAMSGNPENPIVQGTPLPKPSLPNPNQLDPNGMHEATAAGKLPSKGLRC